MPFIQLENQPSATTQNVSALGQGLQNFLTTYKQRKQDKYYRSAAAKILGVPEEQISENAVTPETYGALLKEKISPGEWKPKTKEEAVEFEQAKKTPSESVLFRDKLKNVLGGGDTYDALKQDYPDRLDTIKKIEEQNTPVEVNPNFKEAKGFFGTVTSAFNPNQAPLNQATKNIIGKIKSRVDLQELLKDYSDDPEQFSNRGIDVKAIKEYFRS